MRLRLLRSPSPFRPAQPIAAVADNPGFASLYQPQIYWNPHLEHNEDLVESVTSCLQ
jgi:hypothetical protein